MADWGRWPEEVGEGSTAPTPKGEDGGTDTGAPSEDVEDPSDEPDEPEATGPAACLVYAEASRDRVRRYRLDDASVTTLGTVSSPHGLDVDARTGDIYLTTWPSGTSGYLQVLGATGSVRTLYSLGGGGQGLAIDPSSRQLYWGEYYDGLFVGSMDGSAVSPSTTLASTAAMRSLLGSRSLLGVGMAVALDPEDERLAFFSRESVEGSGGDAIWTLDADGSGLDWIWRGTNAECMAVDFEAGHVYYMVGDGVRTMRAIWRFALDGSSAEELFEMPAGEICTSIAWDPVDEWLYLLSYPDVEVSTLRRMREDGSELEVLVEDIRGSRGLKILYEGADGGICSR